MLTPPVEPMLARAAETLPGPRALRGGTAYEPKFDGFRGLIFVDAGRVRIQSRSGKDITTAFPDLAAAAAGLPEGTVLDGELVVLGTDGRLDFTALGRRVLASPGRAQDLAVEQPAGFIAFDVLSCGGQALLRAPFARRRHQLEDLLDGVPPPVQLVPQTTDIEVATEWLTQYASAHVGLEGVVAKGLDDPYEPGRRGWVKVRVRSSTEALVGAVTGPLSAPGRLVLGLPDKTGRLVLVGGTTELGARHRAEVLEHLREPEAEHPWPTTLPSGRMGRLGGGPVTVTLVHPVLVVEISADTSFEHGRWRHLTRFIRVRPDLGAGDLTWPGT